MSEKISNTNIEEEEEIIELINDEGEHEFFLQVAVLPHGNDWFVCLKPCDPDGNPTDEEDIFFLKIDEDEEGQDMFEVVTDEKILNDLYDEVMNETFDD